MGCREFRETFSDFVDGLLDETAEVEARGHLAACPACRRFEAAYRTGLGALRSLPAVGVRAGFPDLLRRRLERQPVMPALAGVYGAAGAVLLVSVVLFALRGAPADPWAALPIADTAVPMVAANPPATDSGFEVMTFELEASGSFVSWSAAPPLAEAALPGAVLYPRVRFEVPAVWGSR